MTKPTSSENRTAATKAIDEIFAQAQVVPAKPVLFLGAIWFAVLIAYRLYSVNFDVSQFFKLDANTTKFVADSLLAVSTNIFAGMMFAYFLNQKESRREDLLRSIGKRSLIKEVCEGIIHYRGVSREDFRVTARLVRHPTNHDYFLLEMRYEYEQSVLNRSFRSVAYRKNSNNPNEILPNIAEECFTHEWIWYADEITFPSPPQASDYVVKDLTVGTFKYAVTREQRGEHLYFIAELPQQPDPFTYLSYTVVVPIEKNGAITITAEFPSERASVSFDYSDVQDQLIQPICFPKIGLKLNPLDMSNHAAKIFNYRHSGWLLPKDNFTFVWWKK